MTDAVRHVLELFDHLSEPDKTMAVVEILRRSAPTNDLGLLEYDALADELFTALDGEEAVP